MNVAIHRDTTPAERRRAAAICNVIERLEFFAALTSERRDDVLIRLHHAENIVDAVLALTRAEE